MDKSIAKLKLEKFVKAIIRIKQELNLDNFFELPFPDDKLKTLSVFHSAVLEVMAKIYTSEELDFLNQKENSVTMIKQIDEVLKSECVKNGAVKTRELKEYLWYMLPPNGIYGHYYKLTPSGFVFNDDFEINTNFNGDYKKADQIFKNMKRIRNFPDVALIITQDGKCYNSKIFHEYLTRWFVYMGKEDINGIARIRVKYERTPGYLGIEADDTLESVTNLSLGKNNDLYIPLIALTEAQVKTIMQIYDVCIMNRPNFIGLENILATDEYVSGLGFDQYSHNKTIIKDGKEVNITKHNLSQFERYRGYFKNSTFNKILLEKLGGQNYI